jgi:hypothetical protein
VIRAFWYTFPLTFFFRTRETETEAFCHFLSSSTTPFTIPSHLFISTHLHPHPAISASYFHPFHSTTPFENNTYIIKTQSRCLALSCISSCQRPEQSFFLSDPISSSYLELSIRNPNLFIPLSFLHTSHIRLHLACHIGLCLGFLSFFGSFVLRVDPYIGCFYLVVFGVLCFRW